MVHQVSRRVYAYRTDNSDPPHGVYVIIYIAQGTRCRAQR